MQYRRLDSSGLRTFGFRTAPGEAGFNVPNMEVPFLHTSWHPAVFPGQSLGEFLKREHCPVRLRVSWREGHPLMGRDRGVASR